MQRANAVIIGSPDDPHVAAVLEYSRADCLVVDAKTLRDGAWSVGPRGILIDDCEVGAGARGWVRRLAPAGYQDGITLGGQEAAEHSAWLALLAAVVHHAAIEWLSTFDAIVRAEDKLVQYAAADRLGIQYPDTIVTSSRNGLAERFGEEVVVKPLGAGQFHDAEQSYKVVTAQLLAVDDERLDKLAGAPFIVQQPLDAVAHLRVVTVGAQVGAARLSADGLPLDWRADAEAHRSFLETAVPQQLAVYATRLCRELRVGFSSQDWVVVSDGGPFFLDLNPAGQWLFLPPEVAEPATKAIAAWLDEENKT